MHDVGAVSGDEPLGAAGDFAGSCGIQRSHANSVCQRQAGEPHQIFDAAVHVESAAGEPVGACEHDASVAGEIDRLVGQVVAARGGAGWGRRVGDQDASIDGLGANGGFEEGSVEVDAVHDEIRHQAVLGELFPDVVRVAAEDLVRTVAEVGGKGCTGGNCLGDLRAAGLGVADGGDDSFAGDAGESVTMRMRPPAASCQR